MIPPAFGTLSFGNRVVNSLKIPYTDNPYKLCLGFFWPAGEEKEYRSGYMFSSQQQSLFKSLGCSSSCKLATASVHHHVSQEVS